MTGKCRRVPQHYLGALRRIDAIDGQLRAVDVARCVDKDGVDARGDGGIEGRGAAEIASHDAHAGAAGGDLSGSGGGGVTGGGEDGDGGELCRQRLHQVRREAGALGRPRSHMHDEGKK
jgi:hypothetical protein